MECELDGIKVHYESCGDGRPIVALHGWVDADALVQPCPAPVGTFAALDRSGHFMGVEQEDLFRSLAGEWLDRVEEYAGSARSA
jgi:pimeloyl-ACP methyl ester carboxylesterase